MKARVSAIVWLCALAICGSLRAELPLARLHSIFPPGGQKGTTVELTVEGVDLDDASRIWFSAGGVTAERKGPNIFAVTVSSNVPVGLYEGRVAGRFGVSNPRFFRVGDLAEVTSPGTNSGIRSAFTIAPERTVNAFATAAAADYYKFDARAGERIYIICDAAALDSKTSPAIVLLDASGHELDRDRINGRVEFNPAETASYIIKVHDLQFRGGKQFPYRLTVTSRSDLDFSRRSTRLPTRIVSNAEMIREEEPNDVQAQVLKPPCEVDGLFGQKGDLDRFAFKAKKGDVYWIEIFSERLGQRSDPFVVIQKEKADGAWEDIQELYDSDSNVGGPFFNTASRDPVGRLEVKEDGLYRVQVRNLFTGSLDSSYRLSIHREAADFDLVALIIPPPGFDKDKREAQVWSAFLRQNDSVLIKVLALRRDGFAGEISLMTDGLPAGIHASESTIAEGQNVGWLTITSGNNTSEWLGPLRIMGRGKAGTNDIERNAYFGTVLWDVGDYNNEAVRSRLMDSAMLATSSETAPFSLEPKQQSGQFSQASKIEVPLRITRSPEFKQPVKIRAYVDAQNEPIKEWQVDGNATEAIFEMDVKQSKLSAGPHQLFFLAQTGGKIRRVRPDEVPKLEEAAKQNEAERKAIEARLQWKDASAIFCSPLTKIVINPAPTASK